VLRREVPHAQAAQAHEETAAAAYLQEMPRLPFVGIDMELAKLAASLKAEHNLPYAECFATALTQARKATLATSDKGFDCVATALKMIWV
jgi:hypothetical protein